MKPRLIALGGHEFRSRPGELAIVERLLGLTGAERPRVCLLPTASGDPQEGIQRFYATMGSFDCEASHVSLFRLERERVNLREHLLAQDLVYVAGGSMLNLMAIWRAHGLFGVMREAWERGILIAGQSAGAMCWFERGVTASAGEPRVAPGMGLLPGSLCVHYARDPERRTMYLRAVRGGLEPGFALDDGAGVLFEGRRAVEAFTARPDARVIRVLAGGVEVRLRPIALHQRLERERDPSLDELRELRRARERRGAGRARAYAR